MDDTAVMAGPVPRIMVVDDDRAFREMLRDLLAEEGFAVVAEAGDGAEAVAAAERTTPDVVLMDLRMPNVDGIQATRSIKELQPLVQVIMLSAYGDPALQRGAEDAGVYCYLIKGCPPAMIREMLRYAWRFKIEAERNPDRARALSEEARLLGSPPDPDQSGPRRSET